MRRIVWIGVALLIMVGILAFGLHTLNDIDRKNKEYRERKEGEAFASQIAVVHQTTSIYDKLRATESETTGAVVVVAPDGEQPNTEANEENAPVTPDAPEQIPEQTTTVTNDVIVVTP